MLLVLIAAAFISLIPFAMLGASIWIEVQQWKENKNAKPERFTYIDGRIHYY